MADVVIKAPPMVLHISPLGFHHYAAEFLRASHGFQNKDSFSPVPYYLYCRSIELVLKAFLLAKGVSKKELKGRKLGHDLERVLEKACSMGLDEVVSISTQHREELKKANAYYASKGFEYFEVTRTVTGYRNLPALPILTDLASLLVAKVEPVCWQASNGPL